MTKEQKQEFEQWYQKVLVQSDREKLEAIEHQPYWLTGEKTTWIGAVPTRVIALLTDEKLFELRELCRRFQ